MSSYEVHIKKYKLFKRDAMNEENSKPTRIEATFEACFHLIEACAAKNRIHINKHQLVRNILEENPRIFEKDTENVWKSFQEIENQIRPGQIYGGKIDGEQLKRTKKLADKIENICKKILGEKNAKRI